MAEFPERAVEIALGVSLIRGGANLLKQVAEIVSSYVSHHSISPSDLPALIANTHGTLRSLSGAPSVGVTEKRKPSVSIRRSVTPDFIICLDDGKKFKSMKGHLAGLGMTPGEYRAKWGLPADYPMVSPNYSQERSKMAKSSGFGRNKPVGQASVSTNKTWKPMLP